MLSVVAWDVKHGNIRNNNKHMRRLPDGHNENNQMMEYTIFSTTKSTVYFSSSNNRMSMCNVHSYSKQQFKCSLNFCFYCKNFTHVILLMPSCFFRCCILFVFIPLFNPCVHCSYICWISIVRNVKLMVINVKHVFSIADTWRLVS